MPSSEIKRNAREALTNKWGKAVGFTAAYMLISFILGLISGLSSNESLSTLLSIVEIVITVPLAFGLVISFIQLKRDEDVSAFDFLKSGFNNFSRAWSICLYTFWKMLLPIVCMFLLITLTIVTTMVLLSTSGFSLWFSIIFAILYIATIVYIISRSLLYSLAYYIGYDEPNLSAKECVNKSEELMRGNRGNIFILMLSFIGWAIVSCLTLGIGFLWLFPYIQVSMVSFYERITNK